jgi:MOSC domain-containing protein YiiM
MPTLAQLNVSQGGIPKLPVDSARVTRFGVEGDFQKNLKYHGGPNRAVCLYSTELYAELRSEGVDVDNGFFGENFTTTGLDLTALDKGDRLRVGECVIEITDVRVPCNTLKKWSAKLPKAIVGRSGWVAKVVEEAVVKAGDDIQVFRRLASRPNAVEEWSSGETPKSRKDDPIRSDHAAEQLGK